MQQRITEEQADLADAYGRAHTYGGAAAAVPAKVRLRKAAGLRAGILGAAARLHYAILRRGKWTILQGLRKSRPAGRPILDFRAPEREGYTGGRQANIMRMRSSQLFKDYVPWFSHVLIQAGVPRESLRCPCGRGALIYLPGECIQCAHAREHSHNQKARELFLVRWRTGCRFTGRHSAAIFVNHTDTSVTIY